RFTLPSGYHYLPPQDLLPVVVAARLSLSFPFLISAVRFYTVNIAAAEERSELTIDDLQENWFSDGGICSNFPIHLFDAWMPTRPTFGINLASVSKITMTDRQEIRSESLSATKQEADQRRIDGSVPPVRLPKANDYLGAVWDPVTSVPAFL